MKPTFTPDLLTPVNPQRQDGVNRAWRKEHDIIMHAIMSLRALFLDPLAHLPGDIGHVHLYQFPLVSVLVHAIPGSGVLLLVVKHFELRRKRF